ncbi:hypothetical protein V3I05_07805 [Helicobacter mastomyrinus]|uniref:Uncharacterized protein n=1 Tax=Helicobacter mastomyrinus TaxID=287948 RepID=A0ABZ3F693_9HELI
MTFASFVAFLVFMFVAGGSLVLVYAWFISDFVFKRLYLKTLFHKFLENSIQTKTRTKNTQTPSKGKEYFKIIKE